MKANLDDPRTTLRLRTDLKKKAYRIAEAQNISVNQYIEQLIERANESDSSQTIREEITAIHKKLADLDAHLNPKKKK